LGSKIQAFLTDKRNMKKTFAFIIVSVLCAFSFTVCLAQDYPKAPVWTLKYDGTHGFDTDIDTDELLPASMRHSFILKMVEDFNKDLTLTVPFQYTRKEYFSVSGNYFYVRLAPYLNWELGKEHTMRFSIITKWMDYSDPDASSISKDYLQLAPSFVYTFKPTAGTKLMATIKSGFMVYDNTGKRSQDYAIRLSAETRLNQFTLEGYYGGTIMLPLGTESNEALNFLNTFGASLEWNPNRVEKE
jgi:hypothetical protein